MRLRPGLSCTADIQTNMVTDVVAVPMQSVTIRTGDSDLSPEEIEKRKQKQAATDKADNAAELTNQKLEKKTEKEEREKVTKGVFTMGKDEKAHWVKVTTGIADDTYMEIKSGVQPGDEVISGSYSAISRKLTTAISPYGCTVKSSPSKVICGSFVARTSMFLRMSAFETVKPVARV